MERPKDLSVDKLWREHLFGLAEREQKGGIMNKLTLPVDIRIAVFLAPVLGKNPEEVYQSLKTNDPSSPSPEY